MIKPVRIFFLLMVVTVASSFTQGDEDQKERGSFYATLDGKVFQLQEDQLYRGLLMNKTASMDGRIPARNVISTTFNGQSYDIADDKLFTETVQFEIGFESENLGEPSYYAAALQFQSDKYYLIKDQSKLTVTQLNWESDKKHFRISADYDCKMRSWSYPSDGKKDVNLKGRMTNIRITVPSWLAAKN